MPKKDRGFITCRRSSGVDTSSIDVVLEEVYMLT